MIHHFIQVQTEQVQCQRVVLQYITCDFVAENSRRCDAVDNCRRLKNETHGLLIYVIRRELFQTNSLFVAKHKKKKRAVSWPREAKVSPMMGEVHSELAESSWHSCFTWHSCPCPVWIRTFRRILESGFFFQWSICWFLGNLRELQFKPCVAYGSFLKRFLLYV